MADAENLFKVERLSSKAARPAMARSKTAASFTKNRFMNGLERNVQELEQAEHVHMKLRRVPPKVEKNPALEWVPLVEDAGVGESSSDMTYADLRELDRKRKTLLTLARSTSAIDTLIKISTLPRTTLPRLAKKPLIWLLLIIFGAGNALARLDLLSPELLDEAGSLDGVLRDGGTMVTFMVVFYVGYCYSRSNQQFDDVQLIMHAINDACLAARVTFSDPDEVPRMASDGLCDL